MSWVLVIAAAVVCGVAAYMAGPWLLRRIPEPTLAEGVTKTPYARLATRRAALWSGAIAVVAGGLLASRLGWSAPLAAWLVLAVSGAVLCYIDLLTRFLPSAIIWPTYGAVAVLLVVGSAVTGNWHALLRAVEGGALAFGFFYLMWFVYPKGIGFGDVRLSGLLGGALAWLGWGQLILGMYGGFVLGAVLGIVLTVVRVFERKAFAFGPFMLAGALFGALAGAPVAHAYLS